MRETRGTRFQTAVAFTAPTVHHGHRVPLPDGLTVMTLSMPDGHQVISFEMTDGRPQRFSITTGPEKECLSPEKAHTSDSDGGEG